MKTPTNAFYVRNHSATQQLTVFAEDNKQARSIAHELIGERNKSRLIAFPANKTKGYIH